MRTFVGLLLMTVFAGCTNYQEPQANCFSFVSRGPTALDCSFETLGPLDLHEFANE